MLVVGRQPRHQGTGRAEDAEWLPRIGREPLTDGSGICRDAIEQRAAERRGHLLRLRAHLQERRELLALAIGDRAVGFGDVPTDGDDRRLEQFALLFGERRLGAVEMYGVKRFEAAGGDVVGPGFAVPQSVLVPPRGIGLPALL